MAKSDSRHIAIMFAVTVHVDPTDEELLAAISESGGSSSIVDVVRSEIESNLESVSYVRHVSIT